jgi:hypothetical protein
MCGFAGVANDALDVKHGVLELELFKINDIPAIGAVKVKPPNSRTFRAGSSREEFPRVIIFVICLANMSKIKYHVLITVSYIETKVAMYGKRFGEDFPAKKNGFSISSF